METSSKTLLSEYEAAFKLGITRALLNSYTLYPPKTHLKNKDTLPVKIVEGARCFSIVDLEKWDQYLQKPWAHPGEGRIEIPEYIKEYVQSEAGSQCAVCESGFPLEYAHIEPYSVSRSHYHHNLIRLCVSCHKSYDKGLLSKEKILSIKARLIERVRGALSARPRLLSNALHYSVPQPRANFVGRTDELAVLSARLNDRKVILIHGVGGIGKTELVLKALYEHTGMNNIWFAVEGFETARDLEVAFVAALQKFGLIHTFDESIVEALGSVELCVIFDGLETVLVREADAISDFISELARRTSVQIIVTSQVDITLPNVDIYRLPVTALPEEECKQLLLSVLEDEPSVPPVNGTDIDRLVEFCDGHPLSAQLVLGLIRHFKDHHVVIERLLSAGAAELKDPRRVKHSRSTALDVCLTVVYSSLSETQKRLARFLSAFPAGCEKQIVIGIYENSASHHDLANILHFSLADLTVDAFGCERAHILNPVRLFIENAWDISNPEGAMQIRLDAAESVLAIAMSLKLQVNERDLAAVEEALLRFDIEFPNILSVMRSALQETAEAGVGGGRWKGVASKLSKALSDYLLIRGSTQYGMDILRAGIDAMKAGGHHNADAVAQMCHYLFEIQRRAFNLGAARKTIEGMRRLSRTSRDPEVEALVDLCRGDLAFDERRYDAALANYRRALPYFRARTESDPSGIGDVSDVRYYAGTLSILLGSIGMSYERLGSIDEALAAHQESLTLLELMGATINIGVAHHHIGNCYAYKHEIPYALEHYMVALEYFARLGFARNLSNTLGEIGECVVESRRSDLLAEQITEEVLTSGLNDASEEIVILHSSHTKHDAQYFDALRKLFGIIKLVSFTQHMGILSVWAEDFGERFLRPLSKEVSPTPNEEGATIYFLYVGLRSAVIYGHVLGQGDLSVETMNDWKLRDLCEQANLLYRHALDRIIYPFEWLAALLHVEGLSPAITATSLQRAATRVGGKETQLRLDDLIGD